MKTSRNQTSNTSRPLAAPVLSPETEKVYDAIDTLDLSAFTVREKAIIDRASAFLTPENLRYFVRAARNDVAA